MIDWDKARLANAPEFAPLREFQTSEMRQGAVQGLYLSDHPYNSGVGWIIWEGNMHMERTEIPPADPNVGYKARIDRAISELTEAVKAAPTPDLTTDQAGQLHKLLDMYS